MNRCYNTPLAHTMLLENTGSVVAQFHFIPKLQEAHFCKPWLTVEPPHGIFFNKISLSLALSLSLARSLSLSLSLSLYLSIYLYKIAFYVSNKLQLNIIGMEIASYFAFCVLILLNVL